MAASRHFSKSGTAAGENNSLAAVGKPGKTLKSLSVPPIIYARKRENVGLGKLIFLLAQHCPTFFL